MIRHDPSNDINNYNIKEESIWYKWRKIGIDKIVL